MLINGALADKVARMVAPSDAVELVGPPPRFVSRGGEKLDAALDAFAIPVGGVGALDAGASTGGFTDALLQRGAAHVVALDVGHGQLHPRIREHPRVTVIERFNLRRLTADDVAAWHGPFGLVVADLSFISLTKVVDPLLLAALAGASLVLLVKPQFEAGRQEASRGDGVITDPVVHDRACRAVEAALVERGCVVRGRIDSPITGAQGNREFLVHATAPEGGSLP